MRLLYASSSSAWLFCMVWAECRNLDLGTNRDRFELRLSKSAELEMGLVSRVLYYFKLCNCIV